MLARLSLLLLPGSRAKNDDLASSRDVYVYVYVRSRSVSVPTYDGVGAWCTAGERNPVCTQVAMRAYREQSLAMGPARLGVVVGTAGGRPPLPNATSGSYDESRSTRLVWVVSFASQSAMSASPHCLGCRPGRAGMVAFSLLLHDDGYCVE